MSSRHGRIALAVVTLLALLGFASSAAAAPAPARDYRFNQSLTTSVGTGGALTAVGTGVSSYPTEWLLDDSVSTTSGASRRVGRVEFGSGFTMPTGAGSITDPAQYSIALLVRPDESTSYERSVMSFGGGTVGDPGLFILDGKLHFKRAGVVNQKNTIPRATLPADGYSQIVVTRTKATKLVSVYVNRALEFSFTDSADLTIIQGSRVRFFQDDGGYHTSWTVGRLRAFNEVLTAAEVTEIDADRLSEAADGQQTPAAAPTPFRDYRLEGALTAQGGFPALTGIGFDGTSAVYNSIRLNGAPRKVLDVPFGHGLDAPIPATQPRNAYTVAALVRVDDYSSYDRQLFAADAGYQNGLFVNAANGRLRFAGLTNTVTPNRSVARDRFAHIVLTRNEAGRVEAWFDGVKQVSGNDFVRNGWLNTALRVLHSNSGHHTPGELARLRTWNYPLSDAQIASIETDKYSVAADNKETAANPSTPLRDYQLSGNLQKAGSTADQATLVGGGAPTFAFSRVAGQNRKVLAVPFADGLDIPNLKDKLPRNEYTLSGIVRIDDFSSYARQLFSPTSAGDRGLAVDTDGKLTLLNGPAVTKGTKVLDRNAFVQLTLTRDEDSTLNAYVDGVRQFSVADPNRLQLFEGAALRMFHSASGHHFAGEAGRVRLWDYALPQAHVDKIEADRAPAPDGKENGAVATPLRDYQLNNSLAQHGSAQNPATMVGAGAPAFVFERVSGQNRKVLQVPFADGLDVAGLDGKLPRNAWTMSGLVRLDTFASYARQVFSTNAADRGVAVDTDGRLTMLNGPALTKGAKVLDHNGFVQITYTRDEAGKLTAYADGVKQFEVTDADRSHIFTGDILRMFYSSSAHHAPGGIARVRVWDYTLPQSQVTQIEADRAPAADGKEGAATPATPLRDYRLTGSLAEHGGGPAMTLTGAGAPTFNLARVNGVRRKVLSVPFGDGADVGGLLGSVPRNAYTLSGVLRLDDFTSYQRSVFSTNAANRGLGFDTDRKLRFFGNPTMLTRPPTAVGTNPFIQLTLTREESGRLIAYIDGVKQFEVGDTDRSQLIEGQVLRLFHHSDLYHGYGELARLRVWDYALPAAHVAQIEADRDVGTASAPELRGDYRFRATLAPFAGAAPNLVDVGSTSFEDKKVDGGTKRTGRFPQGNGYQLATGADLPRNAYSVVLLARLDNLTSYDRTLFRGPDVALRATPDGRLRLSDTGAQSAAGIFTAGTDHQVVLTRDEAGAVKVYLDGVERISRTADALTDRLNDNLLTVLQDRGNGYDTAGNVSRLRVYDGALSGTQVAALDRLVRPKIATPAEGQRVGKARVLTGVGASELSDDASFPVKLYSGEDATGTPVDTVTATRPVTTADEWTSAAPNADLPSGTYTARAEQQLAGDAPRTTETSPERTYVIDATPPAVTIAADGPKPRTKNATPSFNGAGGQAVGDIAEVELELFEGPDATGTNLLGSVEKAPVDAQGGWAYTGPTPAMTDGTTYTLRVVQRDDVSNVATITKQFVVDTTAPVVTLSSPAARTKRSTPEVGGTAGTAVGDIATVEVELFEGAAATGESLLSASASAEVGDGGAFVFANDAPMLTDGTTYTYRVTQRDEAGNVKQVTRTFVADRTAPLATIDADKPAVRTKTATPAFAGNAGNATGDNNQVTVELYSGSSATLANRIVNQSVTRSANRWAYTSATPALGDGPYHLVIKQSDSATNQKVVPRSFTVDTTGPADVTIDEAIVKAWTNDTTPAFGGTGGRGAFDAPDVTLALYGGSTAAGANLLPAADRSAMIDPITGGWGSPASPTLVDGNTYTLQVTQVDDLGNASTDERTFRVDTTGPAVDFASDGPSPRTKTTTPQASGPGGGADGDAGTVVLELFSGPDATGVNLLPEAARTPAVSGGSWSMTSATPTLAEGQYTYRVTQTDAAGNTTVKTKTFVVDTTKPTSTVAATAGPPSNAAIAPGATTASKTILFTTTPSEGSTFKCKLSSVDADYRTCNATEGYANLADGTYTFSVLAIDEAGNEQASATTFAFTMVRGVHIAGGVIAYASGAANDAVTVRQTTAGATPVFLIKNTGVSSVPAGEGCTQASSIEVTCPVAGITRMDLNGGPGTDSISAPINLALKLEGGTENDRLFGGSANDALHGGDGDDLLDGRLGADDMRGDAGTKDAVTYSQRTVPVTLSFDGVANDGAKCGAGESPCENDALGQAGTSDVEIVHGGTAGDTITGAADSVDTLNGGDGDDTLDGKSGRDALSGQNGNDKLSGGPGPSAGVVDTDRLVGGEGTDLADYSTRTTQVNLKLNGLADDGRPPVPGIPAELDSVALDVENVKSGSGADQLYGSSKANVIEAGAGPDLVDGMGGADTLNGGAGILDVVNYAGRTAGVTVDLSGPEATREADAGNEVDENGDGRRDLLLGIEGARGGSARDILTAGPVAVNFTGNAGNDRIEVRNGKADTVNCGTGTDDVVADVAATDSAINANCEAVGRG